MKYSLASTQDAFKQGKAADFLFFWGHQPHPSGKLTKSCFSQWWEHSFEVDEKVYRSAEHWMMAEKARLFKDDHALQAILECHSPKDAKAWGRKVKGFDSATWEAQRYRIVFEGNLAKFGSDPAMQAFLLGTGDKIIVEASPYDQIWGIGLKARDAAASNPLEWRGLNLLGFALMEVRDRLLMG